MFFASCLFNFSVKSRCYDAAEYKGYLIVFPKFCEFEKKSLLKTKGNLLQIITNLLSIQGNFYPRKWPIKDYIDNNQSKQKNYIWLWGTGIEHPLFSGNFSQKTSHFITESLTQSYDM